MRAAGRPRIIPGDLHVPQRRTIAVWGKAPHDHAVQSNPLVRRHAAELWGIPGIDRRILRSSRSALPLPHCDFADRGVKRVIHYYVERRMEYDCRHGPSSGLPRVQGGQWSSPAFSSWRCRRQAAQSSSKCGDRRGTTSCRGSHQPSGPCKCQRVGFRLCLQGRRAARMSPTSVLSVLPCLCSSRLCSRFGSLTDAARRLNWART